MTDYTTGLWHDPAVPNLENVDAGVRVLLELLERTLDGTDHEVVVQLTTEISRVASNDASDRRQFDEQVRKLRAVEASLEEHLARARATRDLYADTLATVEDELDKNGAQWHAALRELIAETFA